MSRVVLSPIINKYNLTDSEELGEFMGYMYRACKQFVDKDYDTFKNSFEQVIEKPYNEFGK